MRLPGALARAFWKGALMPKRTISVIYEGSTTEIQWGAREPVDGVIDGYLLVHEDGSLTIPFRNDEDEAFVFVLDGNKGRVVASEDQPPFPDAPLLWSSQP
jgi:hypothetical protein